MRVSVHVHVCVCKCVRVCAHVHVFERVCKCVDGHVRSCAIRVHVVSRSTRGGCSQGPVRVCVFGFVSERERERERESLLS